MPEQGRVSDIGEVDDDGDSHGCPGCPHPAKGPGVVGSPNVMVNSLPALRKGDTGIHEGCCGSNEWEATEGSSSVFINGQPAHRVDDAQLFCGGEGWLITGSSNVFTGG